LLSALVPGERPGYAAATQQLRSSYPPPPHLNEWGSADPPSDSRRGPGVWRLRTDALVVHRGASNVACRENLCPGHCDIGQRCWLIHPSLQPSHTQPLAMLDVNAFVRPNPSSPRRISRARPWHRRRLCIPASRKGCLFGQQIILSTQRPGHALYLLHHATMRMRRHSLQR
jgi:hypothetical protein